MKGDKASWTAELTAVFRATETMRPAHRRLLNDRYAACFLRPSLRLILKSGLLTRIILWLMVDRRFPGATDTIVARIRFVDDCLQDCVADGVTQVVILGAGYDARAHRFAELAHRRVYEVDHPATQQCKKEKVAKIFGKPPAHVTYVAVDFEKDDLIVKLTAAGYRPDEKSLFIWEGVCKYLTPRAVKALLDIVASNAGKGSSIVFDYLFQTMVDGSSGSRLAAKALAFQARKGEPYLFGLPEKNPEQFILSRGFTAVKNITAARIKSMYFEGTARAQNLHPFWGIIHARV